MNTALFVFEPCHSRGTQALGLFPRRCPLSAHIFIFLFLCTLSLAGPSCTRSFCPAMSVECSYFFCISLYRVTRGALVHEVFFPGDVLGELIQHVYHRIILERLPCKSICARGRSAGAKGCRKDEVREGVREEESTHNAEYPSGAWLWSLCCVEIQEIVRAHGCIPARPVRRAMWRTMVLC